MKIGLYKDTFANNRGADIAVKNLAAGLAERGHEVGLFDKDEFETKIRGDYDVIVSTGTNEILDLAKVEGLPPIIQQFHTDPAYPFRHWVKKWKRNRAIKTALKKVAAIQVLREEHVEALKKLGISAPIVEVIGNWSSFESTNRSPTPTHNSNSKSILYPAAFNKDKNQILLIKAFKKIAADFPDWEVHLYGRGKLNIKLPPRVVVHDFADLRRPYEECEFVAFPSKTEGFGMVIVEAAMLGKPTLAIENWVGCGEITRPSVAEFAAGLRKLMSDEEYRHRLGAASEKYCMAHYSRETILSQWEDLLRRLI